MKILLLLLLLVAFSLQAQVKTNGLRLWLRADTLVALDTQQQLVSWKNMADQRDALVPAGSSAIVVTSVNGKPSMLLDGAGYMKAPSVFPVNKDFTLIVVAKVNTTAGANNIVSGDSRAFWLNGSLNPRMLHAGNFSQQAVSTVAMNGLSVVRVRFNAASGVARIAVNNQEGCADPIPLNIDSVIYVGAYLAGNFFNGTISEIIVYENEVQGADLAELDAYLHTRYAIPRVPDPPPPLLVFDELPQGLLVARCNDSLVISGKVNSANVKRVNVVVDTMGVAVVSRSFTNTIVGSAFSAGFVVEQGMHAYNILVTADTGSSVLDTAALRRDVTCGEVIAISGQSNSIFGASGTRVSPWARTYGGNFSQQRSDTVYRASTAEGYGGGPNVGAWGLYLQNRIAEIMKVPTLVINGGVGGTRIEQHLPNTANRLDLSTIYGSWLYRIIQSGSRERIRWLFWYQGESNGDNDDYTNLFDQLRTAWLQDLPNLQNIVVVQIRPGCGPDGHDKIRDMQRRLETRYPDVMVHAAVGLPLHDGCHYGADGYYTLGEQLFTIYQRNELGLQPGRYIPSPTVENISCLDVQCTRVRIVFKRGAELRMTPDMSISGAMRTSRDAFFANGDATMLPTNVVVISDAVDLTFASPVSKVSYIPAKNYSGTGVVYEGPWLITAGGVGALTFHNVDVQPTSVVEDGGIPTDWDANLVVNVTDMRGRVVASSRDDVQHLPSGVYVGRFGNRTVKMVVVQ